MKSDIKFRAWVPDRKKYYDVIAMTFDGDIDEIEMWGDVWGDSEAILKRDACDVVLEQFTGFVDFCDKEIYEGDIVEIEGETWGYEECKVVRKSGNLYLENLPDGTTTLLFKPFALDDTIIKVTGNIHEGVTND